MSRSQEYRQAYRAAIKDAVTWLHEEAKRMNDPKARGILNDAAFHMGGFFARPMQQFVPAEFPHPTMENKDHE